MKYIKPILLCVCLGFFMGFFLYSGYEKKEPLLQAFKEGQTLKFLKIGSYSSQEKMENTLSKLTTYIYRKEGETYHAYIGISAKDKNVTKIKEYYQNLGYVTSVEEFRISHTEFLKILATYDELLEKTDDPNIIENIIIGVLTKYEECIDNEPND